MGLFKVTPRQLPPRLAIGAFFINSGVEKLGADEETAARLHGFASGTYPFLAKVKAKDFARGVAAAEIALGATLVLPVVPGTLAGVGLTAFAGGLLGLYARTPGLRKHGTPLPTEAGVPLAKDVWLAGVGIGLVLDDLASRSSARRRALA